MASQRGRSCWTCFARRKGCDRARPACGACHELALTCYGYGDRPLWMNDHSQQRLMRETFRLKVKLITNLQRHNRAIQSRRQVFQPPPPESTSTSSRLDRMTYATRGKEANTTNAHDRGKGYTAFAQTLHVEDNAEYSSSGCASPTRLNPTQRASQPRQASEGLPKDLENYLLITYLDEVIPHKFPFYSPSAEHGGRGWLFCLLKKNKSLYKAALAMAALYRQQSSSTSGELDRTQLLLPPCTARWVDPLYTNLLYTDAINELRIHISSLSLKKGQEGLKESIVVLACIVHLILLEGERGQFQDWQKHLAAAPSLASFLRAYCSVRPDENLDGVVSSPNFWQKIREEHESWPDEEALSFFDHAAIAFFSGVIIWFDILACASTGMRPRFQDLCVRALGPGLSSRIQLHEIMGCQNWVMVLIRDIGTVVEKTTKELALPADQKLELLREGKMIKQNLMTGIQVLGSDSFHSPPTKESAVQCTTFIFAYAALIYLSVATGDTDYDGIGEYVSQIIWAYSSLPSQVPIQGLVWPFCITGCAASLGQRQRFRDFAAASGCYNLQTPLQIMETCWRLRDQHLRELYDVHWLHAMKSLGKHMLLV